MTPDEYRARPPSNPQHPHHQMPWPTIACNDAAQVIQCDSETDLCRCPICGKEWTRACNFNEDFA